MRIKWILLSNVYYVLTQWLVLSVFSKIYTTENVGEYFFSLALATPVMIFFALKLTGYIISTNKSIYSHAEYRYIRLYFSSVGSIFVFILYFIFFYDSAPLSALVFTLIFKVTEQFDDMEAAFKSKEFKFKEFSLIKIRRGTAYLATVAFSSFSCSDFNQALYLSSFFYTSYWLFINQNILLDIKTVLNKELLAIFRKTYPMGTSGSVQSLATSGCRLYIGLFFGNSLLAVFGALSYSMTAINIVTNALGNYFLPYFSKYKSDRKFFITEVIKSQVIIFLLAILLLNLVYFYGEFLLHIVFNEEIASYNSGLLILSICASFKASTNLLGSAIISTEKYTFQLAFTIINLFSLVLLLVFLRDDGLRGVFIATLGATVFEWLLMQVFSFRYFYDYFKKNSS